MKIYIATPVNARKEATLEEKQKAAQQRCYALREEIKKHYPDAEFWSSVTNVVIARKGFADRESDIMGTCVRHVMQSDIVFFDWGYDRSKGCTVEHITAFVYGKKIIHAYDLSIEPEKFDTSQMDFEGAQPAGIRNCLVCKNCLPPFFRENGKMCKLEECNFEEA